MIVKKIPNPKKSATKTRRIVGLGNYITEPQAQRGNGKEKCIHFEACNFLTDNLDAQLAEMVALATETRSPDPIDHWVLSWQEDERPTVAQAREAVETFIEHCGLRGHQFIWGLHDDTNNLHAHIQVNRVHPDTLRAVKINKGFDREAGQQVCALIEHMHGWKQEEGSRYRIFNNKLILRADTDKRKQLKPTAAARAMEQQTGTKSAQRSGIEEAAPIIAAARTWRELHDNLAAVDMRYERKGSGAIIFVGDVAVKASDVSRATSLSALQKRLGAFQPAKEINPDEYHHHTPQSYPLALGEQSANGLRSLSECRLAVLSTRQQTQRAGVLHIDARADRHGTDRLRRDGGRGAEPLSKNQPGWNEYQSIRDELRVAKGLATTEQQRRQQHERDALFKMQKAERNELFTPSWKGRGAERNAMLSFTATRHAAEKLELRERQKAERKTVRQRYQLLPWKEWKESPRVVGQAEQVQVNPVHQPPQLASLLRSLRQSSSPAGHFTYHAGEVALFRDEGRNVAVLDDQSPQSIAAALAVAQAKFGQTLKLTGSPAFQEAAVCAAVEFGLSVKFADPALESMRLNLIEEQREVQRAAREGQRKMYAPYPTTQITASADQLVDVKAAQEAMRAEWKPAREASKAELKVGKVVAVVDGLAILHVGRGVYVQAPIQPGIRPGIGRHLHERETTIEKG